MPTEHVKIVVVMPDKSEIVQWEGDINTDTEAIKVVKHDAHTAPFPPDGPGGG